MILTGDKTSYYTRLESGILNRPHYFWVTNIWLTNKSGLPKSLTFLVNNKFCGLQSPKKTSLRASMSLFCPPRVRNASQPSKAWHLINFDCDYHKSWWDDISANVIAKSMVFWNFRETLCFIYSFIHDFSHWLLDTRGNKSLINIRGVEVKEIV